jgi:hypothetical protein
MNSTPPDKERTVTDFQLSQEIGKLEGEVNQALRMLTAMGRKPTLAQRVAHDDDRNTDHPAISISFEGKQ